MCGYIHYMIYVPTENSEFIGPKSDSRFNVRIFLVDLPPTWLHGQWLWKNERLTISPLCVQLVKVMALIPNKALLVKKVTTVFFYV